jgi:hypothetical protein
MPTHLKSFAASSSQLKNHLADSGGFPSVKVEVTTTSWPVF